MTQFYPPFQFSCFSINFEIFIFYLSAQLSPFILIYLFTLQFNILDYFSPPTDTQVQNKDRIYELANITLLSHYNPSLDFHMPL